MGRFVVRRLLISIPTLLLISIFLFLLTQFMPGDAVDYMIPPEMASSAEARQELRELLNLDRPVPLQYVSWLREVLKGNLGISFRYNMPVAKAIKSRLFPTMLLASISLFVAVIIGIPLGILAAVKKHTPADFLLSTLGLIGLSTPAFFAGLIGIYIFAIKLPWFPAGGLAVAGQAVSIRNLVLPVSVLSLGYIAQLVRYTRSSFLSILDLDYIRTARAKGIAEYIVVLKHAFRNAAKPIITVIALFVPRFVGGVVFVENVFAWPGMGSLLLSAINGRDYPLIMGVLLVVAMLVLLVNIVVDILYAVVDPRVTF